MLQIGICMLVVHTITVRHATAHTASYKFFLNGWKGFCVKSFIQNPTTVTKTVKVHSALIFQEGQIVLETLKCFIYTTAIWQQLRIWSLKTDTSYFLAVCRYVQCCEKSTKTSQFLLSLIFYSYKLSLSHQLLCFLLLGDQVMLPRNQKVLS